MSAATFFGEKLNTLKATKARQSQKTPRKCISSIVSGKAVTEEKTEILVREYENSRNEKEEQKRKKSTTSENEVNKVKQH